MKIFEQTEIKADPSQRLVQYEFKERFLCFCSMICILYNKKHNLANIFLLLLKEKKIMELYMTVCDFDTEYSALKNFLEYDSTLHKSKYIKKYLNAQNGVTAKKSKKRSAKKK